MNQKLKPIAVRIAADVVTVTASLAAALAIRFLLELMGARRQPAEELAAAYMSYFQSEWLLLAATFVAVFAASGVYTRARYYETRHKAMLLLKTVSLSYIAFVFLVYFLNRPAGMIPRGGLVLAYVMTLAAVMGMRMGKEYFDKHFTVESLRPEMRRPVRKVLVVGGAGYIGSGMVRDLLADGYKVRVLDSFCYGEEPIKELYGHPALEVVRGDFRHVEPVVKAVKGMDAVIHLGAIVGDPACAVDEDESVETNLAATRLLAEVCRASGVARVLFASTCSVYGANDDVVDEHSWLNPVSLYAATKIDSEKVLLAARGRDFHPVILRLATAYGWSNRPRFDLVVNVLAAKAVVEKKIVIYNGQQWRPFIHVADISRAFRAALTAPLELVSGEIFNAGSNNMNYTLQELADMISAMSPDLTVEHINNNDTRNYRVSFDKIHGRLGFECKTTLADGIREIQEAIHAGLVSDYTDSQYSNVQLVVQRRQQEAAGKQDGREPMELTALRFAKNSQSLRTLLATGAARP